MSKNLHALNGLYAITDTPLLAGRLQQSVAAALRGGAQLLQYRDKSDDKERRLAEATMLRDLCAAQGALFLVNDDIALAAAVNAPAVHIGQTDGQISEARRLLGPDAIIGVTCHDDIELARQAQAEGADYVAFGAFFRSSTKPEAIPAPLSLLTQAKAELDIPVVAIGGITLDNASHVIAAGADMICVVHSLFGAEDVEAQAAAFSALFRETQSA